MSFKMGIIKGGSSKGVLNQRLDNCVNSIFKSPAKSTRTTRLTNLGGFLNPPPINSKTSTRNLRGPGNIPGPSYPPHGLSLSQDCNDNIKSVPQFCSQVAKGIVHGRASAEQSTSTRGSLHQSHTAEDLVTSRPVDGISIKPNVFPNTESQKRDMGIAAAVVSNPNVTFDPKTSNSPAEIANPESVSVNRNTSPVAAGTLEAEVQEIEEVENVGDADHVFHENEVSTVMEEETINSNRGSLETGRDDSYFRNAVKVGVAEFFISEDGMQVLVTAIKKAMLEVRQGEPQLNAASSLIGDDKMQEFATIKCGDQQLIWSLRESEIRDIMYNRGEREMIRKMMLYLFKHDIVELRKLWKRAPTRGEKKTAWKQWPMQFTRFIQAAAVKVDPLLKQLEGSPLYAAQLAKVEKSANREISANLDYFRSDYNDEGKFIGHNKKPSNAIAEGDSDMDDDSSTME